MNGPEPQPDGVELVAVPVPLAATQPTATTSEGSNDDADAHGPAVELVALPVPLAATQPTAAPRRVWPNAPTVAQLPPVVLLAFPVPLTATHPTAAGGVLASTVAQLPPVVLLAFPVPLTATPCTLDALPVPLTASVLAQAVPVGWTSTAPEHVCADADPALTTKTATAATTTNAPHTAVRLRIAPPAPIPVQP